ncbi:MAG TPA: formylglycine-generating enzyme family protein [Candidatus Cloacimonadota bacterium]|nr:formylglycine-generating enzyme family protein [Candidatus Cloacimonadales bacterium]HPY97393.1 formylglycine-generating enzyme family protein [Candidatus Cloacimonadota bacterium]HQB41917.1 formylglycine-generating enzyme family protein [Candidatus Cloacimonadota bacterium]
MRRKVLLVFILLCVMYMSNLHGIREMRARQIDAPKVKELFLSNPEDGGLVIYSTIPNLRFDSNMNSIVKLDEMPIDGKYKLYLKTMRNQIIIIKSVGYAECHIHIANLQPQEGRYYALEDTSEDEGIGNSVPVIFNVKPTDAIIRVGEKAFKSGEVQSLAPGRHQVKISKEGFQAIQDVIEVSETNIMFNYELKEIEIVLVTINSTPDGADIYIDNVNKGKTERALFLYPGSYNLRVQKDSYLAVDEAIEVKEKGTNSFTYRLNKNSGNLNLTLNPTNAKVFLNNEPVSSSSRIELSPGFYKIEVKADNYESFTETIEIKLGETISRSINLTPKYGDLMLLANPNSASIEISQNNQIIKTITGSQIVKMQEGNYEIAAKASGYKPYNGKFTIKDQQKTELNIELQKEPDIPTHMVQVKGGTFQMGSNEWDFAKPIHQVTLSSFYISKYEVTQKEWQAVMGTNPAKFKGENRPIEKVSWYDAVKYCNKLSEKEKLTPVYTINGNNVTCNWSANGYRLPTEAEWEYAAKGGNKSKGYAYSGSNNIADVAWYDKNSGKQTHEVGKKRANELGLYDMTGNVWEWCWDWHDNSYYSKSPKDDPKGASSATNRILRGSAWDFYEELCRVAIRFSYAPDYSSSLLGFRVVRRKP